MKYLFIKRYNPAYDFFLTRYLEDGGITISEEETRWDREHTQVLLSQKRNRTPYEELHFLYLAGWSGHPEVRPALYNLLWKLKPQDKTEIEWLKGLETQLGAGKGKLLFSGEEAAEGILRFYKNYLTNPLRRDIARGADGQALFKYFDIEDKDRCLKIRNEFGPERVDEEERKTAKELLVRLDKFDSKSFMDIIDGLLHAHFTAPEHMHEAKQIANESKMKTCEHHSEYVWLDCARELSKTETFGTLRLVRGMSMVPFWYQEVQVPEYYVRRIKA